MRFPALTLALFLFIPASSQVLFSSGFEDQSLNCWNRNRNSSGWKTLPCGSFYDIGSWPLYLVNHNNMMGYKNMMITYMYNEDEGRASVTISPQDVVYVRAYYYFSGTFDFPQGLKLGKVKGPAGSYGSFDVILQSQAPHNSVYTQQGTSDNVYLGVFHNNPFGGFDWGEAKAYQPIQRGTPHCIEYKVAMNTPSVSNGQVEVWLNGTSIVNRSNLYIRPTSDWKINQVRFGSNYSNGGNQNPYPHPDGGPNGGASDFHIDEVVVSQSRIGCL